MIKPALIEFQGTVSLLVVALNIDIQKPLNSSSYFSHYHHLFIYLFVIICKAYSALWFHKNVEFLYYLSAYLFLNEDSAPWSGLVNLKSPYDGIRKSASFMAGFKCIDFPVTPKGHCIVTVCWSILH
jgi:hypothetical protein